MTVIEEGTCGEHWGLYGSNGSVDATPETSITLRVN